MKITFILDNFGGGGKEHRCLQLMQGLLAMGEYEIQVILIDGIVVYQELFNCNITLDIIERKKQKLSSLGVFKTVRHFVKKFNPDIVQAWGIMSAFYIIPLSIVGRFAFIVSYVADVIPPTLFRSRYTNFLCCLLCRKIIGNSNAGLNAYKIPTKKSVCIYNGFNAERFKNVIEHNTKRAELGIHTTYVVSMIATFSKYKDWDCFLGAAKQICSQRSDITFLAIGAGPTFEKYRKEIDESRFKLIKLLGRRNDVDEILQITDVSVLCSNQKYHEGLSNTIVESMAWTTPVIATDGGGTPEIICDGENGFLIHNQTSEAVAEMIMNLIDDENTRCVVAQAAKKTIESKFLLSNMTGQYDALYKSVIK